MKFKVAVIAILIAILGINSFMAYTIIQEEKKQTHNLNALINVQIQEYGFSGQKGLHDILKETTIDVDYVMTAPSHMNKLTD